MIVDAISSLNDRTGSSHQAIAKFIKHKHENLLPPNFRTLLSVQLRNFVRSERLFKVNNSYKISSSEKSKLAIHETQSGKTPKPKAAVKITEKKGPKTKRLSHVKTPEAMKKPTNDAKKKSMASSVGKVKRLSQVKTPEVMKKKKSTNGNVNRKTTSKPNISSRPAKRARK